MFDSLTVFGLLMNFGKINKPEFFEKYHGCVYSTGAKSQKEA